MSAVTATNEERAAISTYCGLQAKLIIGQDAIKTPKTENAALQTEAKNKLKAYLLENSLQCARIPGQEKRYVNLKSTKRLLSVTEGRMQEATTLLVQDEEVCWENVTDKLLNYLTPLCTNESSTLEVITPKSRSRLDDAEIPYIPQTMASVVQDYDKATKTLESLKNQLKTLKKDVDDRTQPYVPLIGDYLDRKGSQSESEGPKQTITFTDNGEERRMSICKKQHVTRKAVPLKRPILEGIVSDAKRMLLDKVPDASASLTHAHKLFLQETILEAMAHYRNSNSTTKEVIGIERGRKRA